MKIAVSKAMGGKSVFNWQFFFLPGFTHKLSTDIYSDPATCHPKPLNFSRGSLCNPN